MIQPAVLAQICADAYAPEPAGFDQVWDFAGCHACARKVGEVDVIAFRGSLDVLDWLRDVEAFPLWDYRVGFVHGGFMIGVNDVLSAVAVHCGPRIVVTGHSLGGARARILAALLAYSGRPVEQCTVFGSPRPGGDGLARVLQKSGTPLASYRNCTDPVPLVPFMGGLYEHPDKWISLDSHAAPNDLEPLRNHHMTRYLDGLAKLYPDDVLTITAP